MCTKYTTSFAFRHGDPSNDVLVRNPPGLYCSSVLVDPGHRPQPERCHHDGAEEFYGRRSGRHRSGQTTGSVTAMTGAVEQNSSTLRLFPASLCSIPTFVLQKVLHRDARIPLSPLLPLQHVSRPPRGCLCREAFHQVMDFGVSGQIVRDFTVAVLSILTPRWSSSGRSCSRTPWSARMWQP